ncbi:MAG: biotin transporter BioY [Anaerovoracaceae bacterium]
MNKNKTHMMILSGLFAALIAVGAFIKIPVPYMDYFTLQFFFVILAGTLLGSKLGNISVLTYIFIGLAGVPIFAAGGGLGYIVRPSFGFLIGFVFAALIAGKVCEKFKENNIKTYLIAAFAGLVVTYWVGFIYKYLMMKYYVGEPVPFAIIFASAFPLDIPGDIILCIIAAIVSKKLEIVKGRYI